MHGNPATPRKRVDNEASKATKSDRSLYRAATLLWLRRSTNLNLGQDTRANRTRNTSSRSTKPHTKQQHTNAHQTDRPRTRSLSHTHSPHTPGDRGTMSINRRHRPHGARRTHALYTSTLMSHHMGTACMWWSRGGSFLTKPLRTGWYAALQGRLSSHAEDVACRTGVPHENDCTRLTGVFSGSCTPSTFACGPPASAVPFGFCTT